MKLKALIFFFLSTCLTACQSGDSFYLKEESPKPVQFNPEVWPQTKEEPVKTPSDKWHEDIHFSCKDQDCLPALVMVIKKGYSDDPGHASTCLGYLSSPDTVVTSAACIPEVYTRPSTECKDEIVFKFPSVGESVSEETVRCHSIIKGKSVPKVTSHGNEKKLSLKSEFAILKLASTVNRKPISRHEESLSYLNPRLKVEEKYLTSKLELDRNSNHNSKFNFKISSHSCTALQNKKFILNEPADVVMLDCGKEDLSPGSPIYSLDKETRGKMVGLVSVESLVSSGYFRAEADSKYFALDLSCVDKKDCSIPSVEDHFYEKKFTQDSIPEEKEVSDYRKWLLRQTMHSVIEFEWVNNINKFRKNPYLDESTKTEKVDKTDIVSLNELRSQISMPLPKCIKTTNKNTWLLALLAQPWLEKNPEELERQLDFVRAGRLDRKEDPNSPSKEEEDTVIIGGYLKEKLILLVRETNTLYGTGYFRSSQFVAFDIKASIRKSLTAPKKLYVEIFLFSFRPDIGFVAKVPFCKDIEQIK